MKKLLLTLLLFLSVGMVGYAAEMTFEVTQDNSTMPTSGYGLFSHTDNDSKIKLEGYAYKSNDSGWKSIQLAKSGGYIAITSNPSNIIIKKVVLAVKKGGTSNTSIQVKSSDTPYSYIASNSTSWTGTVVTTTSLTTEVVDYSYEISNKAFVIYNSTSGATAKIEKITVYYEVGPVDFTFFDEFKTDGLSLYDDGTLTLPAKAPTVSYTVENSSVAAVEDGVLKALAVGETNVTATWSASDEWNAGAVSFKVTVTEAPHEAVYDFSLDGNIASLSGLTLPATSSTSTTLDGTEIKNRKVSLITEKNGKTETRWWRTSTTLECRTYADNTIRISVSNGYYITDVVFTATSDWSGLSTDTNGTWNPSTQAKSIENAWTPELNNKPSEVTFTAGGKCFLSKIVVKYTKNEEAVVEPEDYKYFDKFAEGIVLEKGGTQAFVLGEDAPAVSYSGYDANVISVVDNVITALTPGETIIKATWEAVDKVWNAGEAEIPVTVNKLKPDMEFRDQVVIGKLGVGVVWEEVTVAIPADADRADITYSSSDPTIVRIDAESGQIHPEDVLAEGEVTITATLAAKGEYAEGKATYRVIIIDPTHPVEPTVGEFDFTPENAFGMTTQTGSAFETEVTEVSGPRQVVTIAFDDTPNDKGVTRYRLWKTTDGTSELRVMEGGKFTVSVPEEGYKISKIGFVGAKDIKDITSDPVNGASTNITDWDDNNLTSSLKYDWVPASDNDVVKSVTFTVGATTAQISQIYVMFESSDSNLESADLSFDEVIANLYEDELSNLPGVENPNGLDINYSIAGIDEGEYDIHVKDDGTLDIMVSTAGCYTLRATSPANATYRDGLAIKRLNVYRHLDLTVDSEDHIYPTPIYTDKKGDMLHVEIEVPDPTHLFYKLVNLNDPVAHAADSDSEYSDCEPGFEYYDSGSGIDIPANINGDLIFYIAAYGYKSPKRDIPLVHKVAIEEVEVDINDYVLASDEEKFDTNNGVEDLVITMDVPAGFELYYAVAKGEAEAEYQLYEEPITVAAAHHGSLSYYITRSDYTSATRTISLDGLARLVEEGRQVTLTHNNVAGVLTVDYAFSLENHNGTEPEMKLQVFNMLDEEVTDFAPVENPATQHAVIARAASHDYNGKLVYSGDGLLDPMRCGHLSAVLTAKVGDQEVKIHEEQLAGEIQTGIENVAVDAAADAEFFTLEGIRVSEPAAGQFYIKRQGGKAVKVLVK